VRVGDGLVIRAITLYMRGRLVFFSETDDGDGVGWW
jgi:hypothetical protein